MNTGKSRILRLVTMLTILVGVRDMVTAQDIGDFPPRSGGSGRDEGPNGSVKEISWSQVLRQVVFDLEHLRRSGVSTGGVRYVVFPSTAWQADLGQSGLRRGDGIWRLDDPAGDVMVRVMLAGMREAEEWERLTGSYCYDLMFEGRWYSRLRFLTSSEHPVVRADWLAEQSSLSKFIQDDKWGRLGSHLRQQYRQPLTLDKVGRELGFPEESEVLEELKSLNRHWDGTVRSVSVEALIKRLERADGMVLRGEMETLFRELCGLYFPAHGRLATRPDPMWGVEGGFARIPVEGHNWVVPTIQLRLSWIEPGQFMMGSPEQDPFHREDEKRHTVRLTRGYWIGQYEISRGEWQTIMGSLGIPDGDLNLTDLPVVQVDLEECQEFCRRMTRLEWEAGRLPAGYEYRLPSEAQWEYACRGPGTTYAAFTTGETLEPNQANFGYTQPGPVERGYYPQPNQYGLYDLHGNVREWCRTKYGPYSLTGAMDPKGSAFGISQVVRGGGWRSSAMDCRSGSRSGVAGFTRSNDLGFRIVMEQSAPAR